MKKKRTCLDHKSLWVPFTNLPGILVLVASIFSHLSANGAEKVAFVVGNDNYPSFPLENAVRDATAFRDMLLKDLGFATEDVVFMTNGTRLSLYEQFEIFKKKAAGANIALVFYAGHGMESLDGTENFLLPVDTDVTRAVDSEAALRAAGINLMILAEDLADVSDGAKIFLLDACRERPKNRGLGRSGGGLAIYADEKIPADTLMILAAAPKGLASDGDKHGPFTAALLEILPKPGQNLMSAFFAVSDKVQEVTQKQQVPWLKFDGSGTIFRKNSLSVGVPGEGPTQPGTPGHSPKQLTKADLLVEHPWINRQGKEISAVFSALEGTGFDTVIVLKVKEKPAKVLLTDLSEESRMLARGLAALQTERPVQKPPATIPIAPSSTAPTPVLKFGNSRYQLVRGAFTWTEAKKRAEAMGGHLVTITSQQEYDWFRSILPSDIRFVALGGQRFNRGDWEWVTGEPWSFTDWGANEPNGAGVDAKLEFSLAYYKQGGWNDIFDSESSRINLEGRSFMVEWD